ncbi:hypothetical protein L6164_012590 [Bauhinia variegata]|uniref:Uncharacterized protein n=1 Tax=Bauhinia variegata TaxID=167791 RepID=A0ACB9PDC9_BAUVA|nr:hypothetical protein L6164_012590 [Bauhinia variegata]
MTTAESANARRLLIYAIVDTGNSLIWVQGLPFFDPAKSFSYSNLICDSVTCDDLGTLKTCMAVFKGPCTYKIMYADGSKLSGVGHIYIGSSR